MKKLYASFILLCSLVSLAGSAQTYTTLGSATPQPGVPGFTEFQLTPVTTINQAGAVWRDGTVSLTTSWTLNASLNFGIYREGNPSPAPSHPNYRSGADGIVFVLSTAQYLGLSGEEIGYGKTDCNGNYTPNNSLAIEMDTWRNLTFPYPEFDGCRNHLETDGNHIAIMSQGQTTHGTPQQILGPTTIVGELEDGQWHNVAISWNHMTNTLSLMSTSGFAFGASATLTPAQMTTIFAGNNNVFLGFTAGTGAGVNDQRVRFATQVACTPPQVTATVPALGCSSGNVIYLGYGPQSVTATSTTPGTTFVWFMNGTPDVQVGTGATFTPTMAGTYYVVATSGTCTTSTEGAATQITVIDIRCGKEGQDKVYVCHKQNGVHGAGTIGENSHTLCVSVNAVPAHLAHGDCLGSCEQNGVGAKRAPVTEAGENAGQEPLSSLYPNPSKGRVQLNLGKSAKSEIQVVNARGAVVERRNTNGSQNLGLDLAKYGKGLYMVRIITDGKVETLKVMVQE